MNYYDVGTSLYSDVGAGIGAPPGTGTTGTVGIILFIKI